MNQKQKNHILPSFSRIKPVELSSIDFIKWILKYVRPFKSKFITLAFFMIVSSLLSLFPPILMQIAIDEYIDVGNKGGLILISSSIVGLGLLVAISNLLQRYIGEKIGHYAVKQLRLDLFSHLSSLSFSFFDESRTGDLISRVTA
ncbi:MAG: hypothetical protein GF364_00060, partial [Candidatus Lokiarchaeota archaeon]|nr:hypothetical protein [Candidatus Lokiarchaeota archaeon]